MKLRHPLSGCVYEDLGDGTVCVTDPEGRRGWFQPDGTWLRGELRAADAPVESNGASHG
jgi:hypothetical protein